MCVAVPGRVVSIGEPKPGFVAGRVDFEDRTLEVNLVMLPHIEIGDHVLVHSGYAIRVVSDEIADGAQEMLRTEAAAID